MTPQAAAALRCPVCGGALMPLGTSLRCPQGHSYDMAKEGYVNLLAIQKRHAADPGDGKAIMPRSRKRWPSSAWNTHPNAVRPTCWMPAAAKAVMTAWCMMPLPPRAVPAYWPGSTFPRMPSALRQSYCRKPLLRWAAASAPRCGMAGRMFC